MTEAEQARIEAELPYGVWREQDGSEVLFNRHYSPMLRRAPDGSVTPVTTGPVKGGVIWIDWVDQRFLYDTRSPPTHSKAVRQRCEAVLAEWMSAAVNPSIVAGKDEPVGEVPGKNVVAMRGQKGQ